MKLLDRPIYTNEFRPSDTFNPSEGSAYIYGISDEERGILSSRLSSQGAKVNFIKINENGDWTFTSDINSEISVKLRNVKSIENFYSSICDDVIYIDITSLSHSTWAPLIKVGLHLNRNIKIVYFEPHQYRKSLTPKIGEIYDLSERTAGIRPLPMFSSLDESELGDFFFIPLLGFEGARFAHMYEEIQPSKRKTIPIVGVPGFRAEYPFSTFLGNVSPLETSDAQRDISFVRSNCPFSLYYKLTDIAEKNPGNFLKLGLVGTKPHALGAILFAIANQERVEIVYDHAIRRFGRTHGVERCLVYDIGTFMSNFVTQAAA